jgi:GDP-L-fucose synthase
MVEKGLSVFYKDKIVVVTGGTGFVGTNFVEELVRRGAKVRITLHQRPPRLAMEGVEIIRADLTRPEDCLAAMEGVDYVIHAAGPVTGAAVTSGAAKLPVKMPGIPINLTLGANVLQAAWTMNVQRFLLLGSTSIYPVVARPIREEEGWDEPVHPSYFGYGWMRRYLERLAEYVAGQSAMKIAIVRPTAVYGRWDNFDPQTSHVVPALVRKAVERMAPYEVWGTGDEVRDFLHVTDLVQGGLAALEKHAVCDPVNLGYGQSFTIRQLVQATLNAAGYSDAKIVFNSSKPTTIPVRIVDISKARKALGFEPRVSLEQGLADTVQWYRTTAAGRA